MPRGEHFRKVGAENEQRILDLLKQRPMTVRAITTAVGRARSKIAEYLKRLHAEPRRAFICGYSSKGKGRPTPIWSAGNQPDAEFVPLNRPARKTSAAERREQILKLLRIKPRSTKQLAAAMHVVCGTACRYVTQLRKPGARQLFIARWQHPTQVSGHKKGGDWAPVYAVGNKPDAIKPTETPSQRHARLSLDDAYRESRRKERRVRYQIERLRKKPNHWASALGV